GDATEAWDTEAFVVAVNRVRNQSVERNTRLRTERTAGHEFERPLIAAVKLELMRTIVGQSAVKTVEQADEVEQRSDVRVRLAVVVTEQTFIVTNQARINVRSDELIVVRETLRRCELERPVVAAGWTKATDGRVLTGQVFGCGEVRRAATARVEQEVMVTVVERTVLNDFVLSTIDTTDTEDKVTN